MDLTIFGVEKQYQDFLKRVKLDERTMNPIQNQEMRRAFFAGFSTLFVLMRDEMPESDEDEDMINKIWDQMNLEIQTFWQTTGQKPRLN